MKIIENGCCAPIGFKVSGVHAGIRKNQSKKDLALILSDTRCTCASVYTLNLVKGAPIYVTKSNTEDGYAQAIICNSGNANTCNANGIEIATKMCDLVSEYTGIDSKDVIVASTGVIGQPLSIDPIKNSMQALVDGLCDDCSVASEAILTTDLVKKEVAVEFNVNGKVCRIGGIAKGSGMIHPNMATMLVFITTDCKIEHDLLQEALSNDVLDSFNMISVDGDTSTNDMVSILANGKSDCLITRENGYKEFAEALAFVTKTLCKKIAHDGEGATKLLECKCINAKTKEIARTVSKSVICSSLFKAAMFGADANWGRVLCAIGYSKADIDINKIDVSFESSKGIIEVCKNGAGYPFSEEKAKEILLEDTIIININLNDGVEYATAYGCDLTYHYVKINGDYRS